MNSVIKGYKNIKGISNITWITPPFIIQQPQNGYITIGSNYEFTVRAGGSHPLKYMWYKNNIPILNQTTNKLKIESSTITDQANYYCVVTSPLVSNSKNTITTKVASLSVVDNLLITQQPTDLYVNPNDVAEFYVDYIGAEPVKIEWFYKETNLNVSEKDLLLGRVNTNNAGQYHCELSNTFTKLSSDIVNLYINKRIIILENPSSVRMNAADSLTLKCKIIGTAPINYYWRKDGVVIENSYGTINSNDISECTYTNPLMLYVNFGSYDCVMTNVVGEVISDTAKVSLIT
jgi:hypothetical protein